MELCQLDLSRMKMAGFLGGMLVLVNSIFQTTEKELIYKKLFIIFILFILLIYLINNYTKYSKKLNEK
jgi:Ca2+/Na+ antiporter